MLFVNEGCRIVADQFEDAVFPFALDAASRMQICARVAQVVPSDGKVQEKLSIDWNSLLKFIAFDVELHAYQSLISTRSDPWCRRNIERARKCNLMLAGGHLMDSGFSAYRAHYYLEVSRFLSVFFSPHPLRSAYFQHLGVLKENVGSELVKFFQDELGKQRYVRIEWNLPPLLNFIASIMTDSHCSLVDAIGVARSSPHAREFRKWAGEAASMVAQPDSLETISTKQALGRLVEQAEDVLRTWSRDINEGIIYERRTLKLGEIPAIGPLLKGTSMEQFVINDPVLIKSNRYLLFLNDVFRQPTT